MFFLRNNCTESCYCRNGNMTPASHPVFTNLWPRPGSGYERKTQNPSGVDSGIPDPVPPLLKTGFVQSVPSILAWNAGEKASTVHSKQQQNVPNPRSPILASVFRTECFQRSASMVGVEKGLLDWVEQKKIVAFFC